VASEAADEAIADAEAARGAQAAAEAERDEAITAAAAAQAEAEQHRGALEVSGEAMAVGQQPAARWTGSAGSHGRAWRPRPVISSSWRPLKFAIRRQR